MNIKYRYDRASLIDSVLFYFYRMNYRWLKYLVLLVIGVSFALLDNLFIRIMGGFFLLTLTLILVLSLWSLYNASKRDHFGINEIIYYENESKLEIITEGSHQIGDVTDFERIVLTKNYSLITFKVNNRKSTRLIPEYRII